MSERIDPFKLATVFAALRVASLAGCDYVRLLRPIVLKQLGNGIH